MRHCSAAFPSLLAIGEKLARGDFKCTSDIDLAVYGGNFDRFALDVNEETSTLSQFDIVDADRKMQPELLESIEKEGVVLYEKI